MRLSKGWRRRRLWLAVVVTALAALSVPGVSQAADPLSLSLASSRELCTANTLTELSWEIGGGTAPYTLTVDGQSVDADAEHLRVNCGPLTMDPFTGDPLPNQTKTFTASVNDSTTAAQSATASVTVDLAAPLPAPIRVGVAAHRHYASVWWSTVAANPELAPDGERTQDYTARWRLSETDAWTRQRYSLGYPVEDVPDDVITQIPDLADGARYEFAVAALRAEIEAETPSSLNWSASTYFTTVIVPEHVTATATHDTVTVTWDDQTAVQEDPELRYYIYASSRHGSASQWHRPSPGVTPTVTFTGMEPDTLYHIRVSIPVVLANTNSDWVTIQTLPATADWQPLPRGPKKVRTEATDSSITVRWEPPHSEANDTYIVYLFPTTGDFTDYYKEVRWVTGGVTQYTFRHLDPDTLYRIKLIHIDVVRSEYVTTARTLHKLAPLTATEGGDQRLPDETTLPPPYGMGLGQQPLTAPIEFG